MASIKNSSELLNKIYKQLDEAQSIVFNVEEKILKQMNQCSSSWCDENYKKFAETVKLGVDELIKIIIALGNSAEEINTLRKKVEKIEQIQFG